MRILIVNHYSGSPKLGMEYRHFYMAQEFLRLGHAVCIVSSSFSHLRICQPQCSKNTIQMSSNEGVHHIWLKGCEYKSNGFKRLMNMLGFAVNLWRGAKEIARIYSPDIVYTSSPHPFISYGAVRIARKACAKFVFEIRDLWPLSLIELNGTSAYHPLAWILNHAEQYGCSHADRVISLLPKVADYMVETRKISISKLAIIPNGVYLPDWQGERQALIGELAEYMKSTIANGYLIVGYAGSHGLPNALDSLLDAAKLLIDKPIRFVLVGDGHEKVSLQHRVINEKMTNVRMFEPIPKAQMPALLLGFDIAYIGWKRMPIYRFGISPNKMMDYMMAGCPILHSVEAGNDPVADACCGLTVYPESPELIAEGILKLAELNSSERRAMGLRGETYVKENHAYSVLAQKFLSIM